MPIFYFSGLEGLFVAGSAIYLDIDISDAKEKIESLRAVHTEK